ncbi:condensation domain-containing protein, partial [Tsukamurella pulmonis]
WRADHRPPSHNQADHVRRAAHHETTVVRPGEWIGGVWQIDEDLDEDALRRALRGWFGRHEAFRSLISHAEDGTLLRTTTPPESIDFVAQSVGKLTTSLRVYQHLKNYFDATITPSRWPHCVLATVDNPAGPGFTIVFGADHSVMDAYTQVLAISELTELYRAERADRPARLTPSSSYLDFCALERDQFEHIDFEHPAVRTWLDYLAEDDGESPRFGLPLTDRDARANLRVFQSSLSLQLLDVERTAAFDAACKAAGGKAGNGVVGAFARAEAGLTGSDHVRFVMPMHTRSEERWATSAGWFVGLMPVDLALPATSALSATLESVADALRRNRDVVPVPYPLLSSIVEERTGRGLPAPRYVLSYVDVRYVPGAAEWGEQNAAVLRSECTADDELYIWISRSHTGLYFSARFPSNPVASANVFRLIAALREQLAEVIDHASDVPTALTGHAG